MAVPGAPPARAATRVSVADFGAATGIADVGPLVRRALASIEGVDAATLVFPPGTYRFAAEEGTCMRVADRRDLTIEGAGAELVFHGVAAPFGFERCPGLTLRGFSVDWGVLPYVQGDVLRVAPDRRSLVLEADAICAVRGDEVFGRVGLYDRATRVLVPDGLDTARVIERVELTGDRRLSLSFRAPMRVRDGDTLVLRPARSGHPVLSLTECDGFALSEIRIHASPGMAVTAFGCRGGSLRDVTVGIRPGTPRLLSSDADAVHLLCCDGEISVRDCLFEGMGDDGINIAAPYLAVVPAGDDPRAAALRPGADRLSVAALRGGDRVQLVRGDDLSTLDEMTVERRDDGVVHLDRAIPWAGQAGLYLVDRTRVPRAHIRDCRFPGNRARGVLARCDAVIEGCVFERQSSAAILLAPDLMWREGPRVERVSVRDNVIRRANSMDAEGGAVRIGAFLSPDGRSEIPAPGIVNRDVVVERNAFEDCRAAAISASSVRNLHVVDNRLARCGEPAIAISGVRGLHLAGNRAAEPAGIALRDADGGDVILDANANMTLVGP